MRLSFLGAVGGVTGSQFLLETSRARVLVDCGMFQGSPSELVHNRVAFAFEPASLDAALLTHAHLDHCGLLPLLAREGFRGPIHATGGTVELAGLVLLDSGKLQEEFVLDQERWRARHPERAVTEARERERLEGELLGDVEETIRGQPPEIVIGHDEPLYTADDASATLPLFRGLDYDRPLEVAPGVSARFLDAGHILGSAIIRLEVRERDGDEPVVLVVSGDLGRSGTPILRDPTAVAGADWVVCESTYGGRVHEPRDESLRLLAEAVRLTAGSAGALLIPAFAIGRTQEVVWELDRLVADGRIPRLPLYLDSPMATRATDIYRRHPGDYDDETARLLAEGESPLDYPGEIVTTSAAASRRIGEAERPCMIVASNGMLTGGRVVHHLRDLVDDPRAVLLFVGYQGQGTLGAHLQAGAEAVRIDGAERRVRCRVRSIGGFSAHADEPGILAWLDGFARSARRPRGVFLVHGDPAARAALAARITDELALPVRLPRWREAVELA
ncbi:MAG: hypothetical protein A2X23_01120 [Chloroflexi bacterium GWC2_73_18]|nr:MAG: hypothetical protein A2X23_01120 [Chloroflexi bacterium GWC2_73_18]